jgi:hypothetical protein
VKKNLKVGSLVHVWWATDRPDNMATVIAVLPYTGLYPQFFDCVLRLTAPSTHRGWMEMAYKRSDFQYEPRGTHD